jgi:CheY-like chemotaxis protein
MKKVLVADAHASSRELVRIILEQSGHTVWEVSTGPEAVRFALRTLPDLIVLELAMPMLDGSAVRRKLQSDEGFRTPLIAVTASAMPIDRARALSAGFAGYILKPSSLCLRVSVELRLALDEQLGFHLIAHITAGQRPPPWGEANKK